MNLLITVEDGVTGNITLRRDAHGHIVCDSKKAVVTTPAARESKREAEPAKKKTESAKAEPAKAEPAKAEPAKAEPAKPAAKKAKERAYGTKGAKPRRSTSLVWKPTTDAGFKGFVAKTDGGQFKLLKAKGSQWALFRERPDTKPEPLGCFKKEDLGRVAAQRAHDTPARPRPVTEVTIVEVCPMPAGEEDDDGGAPAPPPSARRVPDEAPSAEPAPPAEPAPSAELDKQLMSSLEQTLAALED